MAEIKQKKKKAFGRYAVRWKRRKAETQRNELSYCCR